MFSTITIIAQNLIPNSSFEEYKKCPGESSMLSMTSSGNNCKYWYNPTKASPDYDNACTNHGLYGVPNNYGGKQYPKSGNGYFAIVYYDYNDLMEYIGVELKSELIKDSLYCFKMYVSLADKEEYCVDQFHYALTKEKLKSKSTKMLSYSNYQSAKKDSFLSDKNNWMEIKSIYKANGGEKYLTIGLFNNEIPIKYLGKNKNILKKINLNEVISYYYIDDLTLIKISTPSKCKCENEKLVPTEIVAVDTVKNYNEALDKPFVLKNIVFEVTKSQLLEQSYKELKELATYLKINPNYKIELGGHTDNTGLEEDNLKLSEARAKAVADYLIKEGVEPNRLTYKGYGSKKPIKPNNSEENKLENRRVEFQLYKIN